MVVRFLGHLKGDVVVYVDMSEVVKVFNLGSPYPEPHCGVHGNLWDLLWGLIEKAESFTPFTVKVVEAMAHATPLDIFPG